MVNSFIRFVLLIFILNSCESKEFDNEETLWTYLKNPENGYLQEKNVNGVNFSLLYKPTDLVIAQELMNKNATNRTIDSLRSKYGEYAYFTLSVFKNNKELLNNVAGDRSEFGEMVNTFAFGMKEKVYLLSNTKDTINMLDYIYPRMYGMSNKTSFLLVYPKADIKKYSRVNLIIKDLGLNTGEIRLVPNVEQILKEPKIKL